MTTPPPAVSLPQKLVLEKYLTTALKAVRTGLLDDAAGEIDEGERLAVKFAGRRAAWLSMPHTTKTAKVTDAEKLLAWVREAWPSKVTEIVTIDTTNSDLIACLEQHLPEALNRTPAPDPHLVADLLTGLAERGSYATEKGEKVTEVPGVEVGKPNPVPRLTLEDGAASAIGEAWRAGDITLDGLLALPAGEAA